MIHNLDVIEDLRDAAALDNLVVVTGAGVSQGLKRDDGSRLPNWGALVEGLRGRADLTRIPPEKIRLLNDLLPPVALSELHGDALIEASEILQAGFDKFGAAIADLCREKGGETSEVHRAIAALRPAGVITFNYDRAQENAFAEVGVQYESVVYDNAARIKSILVNRGGRLPFLLKAHGCISRPDSLVLTSSSYRAVLSDNRLYRAFLQHTLIRFAVVIVGFAMRDRDFDQLLSTLEIEVGAPVQRQAFVAKTTDVTPSGLGQRAAWAAISSRFGIAPVYIDDYSEIPDLIRSISDEAGPFVRKLIAGAISRDFSERASAHDRMELLGPIGRRQVKVALLQALKSSSYDPRARSELVYALRGVMDGTGSDIAGALVAEVERAATAFSVAENKWDIECAAHALLTLRRCRFPSSSNRSTAIAALSAAGVSRALAAMDAWEAHSGGVPRLVAYCAASCAEIEARARA